MSLTRLNQVLKGKKVADRIRKAYDVFGQGLVLGTSFGIESALMIRLTVGIYPKIRIIFVDTGYLMPETYEFAKVLTDRFNLDVRTYSSHISPVEMERDYGRLWETNPEKYLAMRKTEPLERALLELNASAILHGVRSYQTKTRARLKIAEKGFSDTIKIHPIIDWTEERVALFFKRSKLPYHPLLEQGYGSVGDWHSTAKGKGREGRWPGQSRDECTFHGGAGI